MSRRPAGPRTRMSVCAAARLINRDTDTVRKLARELDLDVRRLTRADVDRMAAAYRLAYCGRL